MQTENLSLHNQDCTRHIDYETKSKILSRDQVIALAEEWHAQGQCIVFTNGCFDLLHLGHIDYLEKARRLGDHLIVGLNSDRSVKQLKGPSRPILNEYVRARLLAALQFVDIVVMFDESTPIQLVQAVRPNVLVKGGDYAPANIVGAPFVVQNGGNVQTIPLIQGYSTTILIDNIRNCAKAES